jgi:hypothetical protein
VAAFTLLPIVFGLDQFADVLVVGVVEIAAGLLVAVAPRIGGYVVAWLAGVIVEGLQGDFYDVALRDLGLLLAALARARLANAAHADRSRRS